MDSDSECDEQSNHGRGENTYPNDALETEVGDGIGCLESGNPGSRGECRGVVGSNAATDEEDRIGSGEPALRCRMDRCGTHRACCTASKGIKNRPDSLTLAFQSMLQLTYFPVSTTGKQKSEPLVDYSSSILLMSNEYLDNMKEKALRRDEAREEAHCRKEEASQKCQARKMEKRWKDAEHESRAGESLAKENFRQKWTPYAIKEAEEWLQCLLKNPPSLPPLGYWIAPFCRYLPRICKDNMAKRLAKRRCQKFGTGDPS